MVDSLDGYPRAKVLAENVPDPPHPDSRWEDGAWTVPPPPPPSVEDRLAEVEARLSQLTGAANGG